MLVKKNQEFSTFLPSPSQKDDVRSGGVRVLILFNPQKITILLSLYMYFAKIIVPLRAKFDV